MKVYPNPSNGLVTVKFELKQAGPVHVAVYNTLGKTEITSPEAIYEAGTHEVNLNIGNSRGVYIMTLKHGQKTSRQRLIVE
jgi:hypothetical protein